MIKKSGSFVAALVAAVTVCSISETSPVFASSKAPHKASDGVDYSKQGTGEEFYSSALVNDANGNVTQASSQALTKSNYLTGKLDSESEANIIAEFKACGLTESDYYYLKVSKESGLTSLPVALSTPTIKLGWANRSSGNWYYSDNGKTWAVKTWKLIDGNWYYFNQDGVAVIGWKKIDNNWYYFNSDYAMVSNTTIDGYYLTSSGAMA